MAQVSAAPNNNYWHYLDVWDTGQVSGESRLVHYRYFIDMRISGSGGSWSTVDQRTWRAHVHGVNHDHRSTFDTRSGNDWVPVEGDQWIHVGTGGVQIGFYLWFEGWSQYFPAAQSPIGYLWLAGIPKVPAKTTTPVITSVTTTAINYNFFNSPNNNGSAEQTFRHQISTDSGFISIVNTHDDPSSPGVFTGLTPGTKYWIRYASINGVGIGPYSDGASATTLPAVAPGFTVQSGIAGLTATLRFSPPGGVSGVDRYVWERRLTGSTTVQETGSFTGTTGTVTSGLSPGTSYQWRAAAVIDQYTSPYTEWITEVQNNPNTNPGNYFDGSFPDTVDQDYVWTGGDHQSTSQVQGRKVKGWLLFEDGDAESGGEGVVSQATGGFSQGYSAKVTFWTDTTDPGFISGVNHVGAGAVAEEATYVASIIVRVFNRDQIMEAGVTWYDASDAVISQAWSGNLQVVLPNTWTRLAFEAPSPEGAVKAAPIVRDVDPGLGSAGYGLGNYGENPYGGFIGTWNPWQSGDSYVMDGAMLSLGELFPYFDGETQDTPNYDYQWVDPLLPNASESLRMTLTEVINDPLADPNIDCVIPPPPPRPPIVQDPCIDEVGVWRRYWAIIPASAISDWLSVIPTILIQTGGDDARQVRVRIYENPLALGVELLNIDDWVSEQVISYMPPYTTITLDGVSERVWAQVGSSTLSQAAAESIPADKLLYGSNGRPATWPVLSCGIDYAIAFDAPLDNPIGNINPKVALTERLG